MPEKKTIQGEGFVLHQSPAGRDQLHLVLAAAEGGAEAASRCGYRLIADTLADHDMRLVQERLFGSLTARESVLAGRAEVMGAQYLDTAPAPAYIEGRPCRGEGFAGGRFHAVRLSAADEKLWAVEQEGVPLGRAWRRRGNTLCLLQNLTAPTAEDARRGGSVTRMFARAEALLRGQGFSFHDMARTWIYISRLLEWYPEFNEARNRQFARFGLIPGCGTSQTPPETFHLPASTGIRGENAQGAPCVMDLLAARGNSLRVELIGGHRDQKSPFRYGSAFARAAALREPDVTHLLISGTAAIDEQGASLHPGDARAQMEKTLDVIGALLAEKGRGWEQVCGATVFIKRAEDVPVFRGLASERGLENLPAVSVVTDICREELLFEMDAWAAITA